VPPSRRANTHRGNTPTVCVHTRLQELQRWQGTRSEEFANMLAGLATVQHAFHRRAAGVWEAVAADLNGGAGSSDGTSPGAGPSSR
jgi:hypothetical protein